MRMTVVGAQSNLIEGLGLAGGQALERVLLQVDSEHPAEGHMMLEGGSMLRHW